jgi:hypothetical protein
MLKIPRFRTCAFFVPLACVAALLVAMVFQLEIAQAAPASPPPFVEKQVPRIVVVFYDSKSEKTWASTTLHQHMELPANHLGLIFEPHDINAPWPDLTHRDDVRGILLWFHGDTIADPSAFIRWCLTNLGSDRHIAMIGSSTLLADSSGKATPQVLVDQLTALMGVGLLPDYVNTTYKYAIDVMNPAYFGFEAPVAAVLPEFERAYALPNAQILLSVKTAGDSARDVLASAGPRGAYVVGDDYTYVSVDELDRVHWILNPFEFLRESFDTDKLPKPDYTTLDGQRIYFSHIDGDGWRNRSQIPTKEGRQQRAVDVFYDAVLSAYPDLPFTVAPVAADLDPAWCGDDESRAIARKIMALPNVEPASHTYSHALYWSFFQDASTVAAREAPFLDQYPPCIDTSDSLGRVGRLIKKLEGKPVENTRAGGTEGDTDNPHGTPRSYAKHPWDLDNEITGARDYISTFLPPGKKIEVLQWPGDTSPFPLAVRKTADAGLLNINGGDTRFDNEYDSVAWVAPVGRYIDGGMWQIYAAASNENTYTDHWTDRFYGLRFLSQTYANTELPRRVNPINLYFHTFVVDRAAGLAGLKEALDWISKQAIIPIRTSEYIRIANGFYSTKLVQTGPESWKVLDRGALDTIRFDAQGAMTVDYHASTGVIGSNIANGSLYVALDPNVATPVVALGMAAAPPTAQLVASRWQIHGVALNPAGFAFHAFGYGPGNMVWQMRDPGRYVISVDDNGSQSTQTVTTKSDGLLILSLAHSYDPDIAVDVVKQP